MHTHTHTHSQLSLPGQPLPSRLDVEVKSHLGDPDLFLCQSCSAPSQTRYTWCNQDVGDSLIQLSTDEKGFDVNKVTNVWMIQLIIYHFQYLTLFLSHCMLE